jgi:predicted DNA-binding transcriptional regulator YafY
MNRYKSLLSNRAAVSAAGLMTALEVSRANLRRDISKLRDQLHVPIEFNRELGGYQIAMGNTDSEWPGLWFSMDVAQRVRLVRAGKRKVVAKSFELVAAANFAAKRHKIWHCNRQNGITTEREVSPHRQVHYRDNLYRRCSELSPRQRSLLRWWRIQGCNSAKMGKSDAHISQTHERPEHRRLHTDPGITSKTGLRAYG